MFDAGESLVVFRLPVPPGFPGSSAAPQTLVRALHIILTGLLVDTSQQSGLSHVQRVWRSRKGQNQSDFYGY